MKHKKKCGWLLILPNFSHNFQMIVRISIKKLKNVLKNSRNWGKTQGFWLKNSMNRGKVATPSFQKSGQKYSLQKGAVSDQKSPPRVQV